MNDLTFLDKELANEYSTSDATLKAVLPGGKVIHISDNICPLKVLDVCPLLYYSFEYNSQNQLQASIEASSESAVVSLARYCYTGSYLASEPDGDTILLLPHAETYKIAEDFDVPELQIMAHGNFSCQIEYACCLPKPPKDLLDTIRFVYRYFASEEARWEHNLVDTLLNYCVAVYLYHKLGESLDFLTAVHEVAAFRQDLCRTNIARNFKDDCAADIIRLPSGFFAEPSNPPTMLSSRDLPSEMLYEKPCNTTTTDLAIAEPSSSSVPLSFRQRTPGTDIFRREIPHPSKHSVSPSALTAALERYSVNASPDTEQATAEETLRKYKRARIDETLVRLPGRAVLPEGSPPNTYCWKEKRPATIKVEPASAAGEGSYWQGAFEGEMQTFKVATEGTSHSARRLLFEYGRRNVRSEPETSPSPPMVDSNAATTLPHRTRTVKRKSDVNTTGDITSEDEGFAMVHHTKAIANAVSHSPMSSPELVPAASIAQISSDDVASSDDDWTMI
ncbi:uncharacterized protein EKO05_0004746 [Ascochyta rabiei]|uniref:Uncharacterized protein n=1 Tax=Didymella rabiei TaxID=5454 RepID=A0A163KFZ7_DIDRA|nr:uncharacterized protein EKO05_0004746 [Ascochyta rabiei]KZM26973.1 hypothetical protein ST47_g1894 [Ascochyta rabiei]UPX14257.1 hypothetical protein EKO05_0004746 [Ascochyta rabiei]